MKRNFLLLLSILFVLPSMAKEIQVLDYSLTTGANGENVSKTECTYNEEGKITLRTTSVWNAETKAWEINEKTEYSYDTDTIVSISYSLNAEDGLFVAVSKTEDLYDTDGRHIYNNKYKWDSVNNVWIEEGGELRDDNGSTISQTTIESKWISEINKWVYINKRRYDYDNSHQILSENYNWNTETESWVGAYKYEYEYDEKGNYTKISYYNEWDSAVNDWVLSYTVKNEYTYDENGNMKQNLGFTWSAETNTWINDSKEEVTYEDKGKVSCTYVLDSETNTWVNYEKTEYIYTEKGDVSYKYKYSWNSETESWKLLEWNSYKCDYIYDDNGNKVQCIYYEMQDDGQWIESSKYDYAYNEAGELISTVQSRWDSEVNDWLYYQKSLVFYAPYRGSSESYIWDSETNTWKGDFKIVRYKTDGRDDWYENYRWDNEKKEWYCRRRVEYAYNENGDVTLCAMYVLNSETNELELSQKTETVYKTIEISSATPVVNINAEEAEVVAVYNLSGQKVSTSTANLSRGLYIVTYTNGESQKVMVK
ncbi:MAG: hypothetical protein E7069_10530 [Bacteroidales bacterium]|nr:hypothetical protein [Bacteroidales bacterium]